MPPEHEMDVSIRMMRNVPPTPPVQPNLAVSSLLNQRAALVQRFALFAGIPRTDCAQIVSAARELAFPRRKTIFFQGDRIRQVVFLLSGCVKVTQVGPNGQEVILRLSGLGEIVGANGLHQDSEHDSSARTMEPSSALLWESGRFETVCGRFPLLRRNAVRIIERSLNEIDVRFREISTERVCTRLSSQLVRLLSQVGQRVDGHVKIALSQSDLAQLTGTTLFTVSRLLSQWETQGILHVLRECLVVRDVPGLVKLSRRSDNAASALLGGRT